jgi:hypothetical protein
MGMIPHLLLIRRSMVHFPALKSSIINSDFRSCSGHAEIVSFRPHISYCIMYFILKFYTGLKAQINFRFVCITAHLKHKMLLCVIRRSSLVQYPLHEGAEIKLHTFWTSSVDEDGRSCSYSALLHQRNKPSIPIDWTLVVPQSRSWYGDEEKIFRDLDSGRPRRSHWR